MTVAIDYLPASPLLELLAEELERSTRSAGGHAPVAKKHWEDALYGPLSDFLARPGKAFRGALVEICWDLSDDHRPIPSALPLLVEVLHAGSLIVDDIEDGSELRRGKATLHERYGLPLALNAANWMYFWPQVLLERLSLPPMVELGLHRDISKTMWLAHSGQALDLGTNVYSMDAAALHAVVEETTRLKTGALMGLSAKLGARAAGADEGVIARLADLGTALGVALQMLDDATSVSVSARRAKGLEDLRNARPTWPWLWAAEELGPLELRRFQQDAAALASNRQPAETLFSKLLPHATRGQRRATAALQTCIHDLEVDFGGSPGVLALKRQIERLEQSYG